MALKPADAPIRSPSIVLGTAIAVGATVYLILALTVVIPHFRAGGEVHYTSYFGDFGRSPGEIARSLMTRPGDDSAARDTVLSSSRMFPGQ